MRFHGRHWLMILAGGASGLWAQDPLKVAASHYKLIAENEDVRLVAGSIPAGGKTAMHSHPALMAVILEPGMVKWTMPDGKVVQSAPDMKRGTVTAMSAQSHISEAAGKSPVRVVLIEFKKPAPAAGKGAKPPAPASCRQLSDSPHASASLCTGGPGESVARHTHAKNVVYVALTDVSAEIDANGKKRTLEMKRDEAAIAAPRPIQQSTKGRTNTS